MIILIIDVTDLDAALRRIAAGTRDASPLMAALADDMHAAVIENFDAEGRPDWLGLHAGTIAGRTKRGHWPGKILQETGNLKRSIQAESGPDRAVVGTNEPYAAIHQFGGTTRPHVIRPKNKKALSWPGGPGPRKQVKHPGSKIPARPFLDLTEPDRTRMLTTVSAYLRRLANP